MIRHCFHPDLELWVYFGNRPYVEAYGQVVNLGLTPVTLEATPESSLLL